MKAYEQRLQKEYNDFNKAVAFLSCRPNLPTSKSASLITTSRTGKASSTVQ